MFATILFGDGRMEIFNLNCKLINFIHHLKEQCGLDFKDCVDLMDSRGQVMNLDLKQHSMDAASSVLADRRHYVLLRVCRDDESGGRKYISLLNNNQSQPELTELLNKVSNLNKEPERKVRRGRTQRSKNTSFNKN
ncbi:uncharacterized protein C22orf15 [Kryptolebias marmoratus]|uniref:uncharacterized protein C22orf15 n=1 Tax=Kryptolebias marmoratus TaxID=37003 RepID=UPI0007F8943D|nr:uncharacterized protein C22orf15 [Kryptolebias marmoratus]